MRQILLLLFLVTTSVLAEETIECDQNLISLQATTLAREFTGRDCTTETELRDLLFKIGNAKKAKKFCKECIVTPLGSEQSPERKEQYAGAVVGEFKKELTYLTQDLLNIRETSFKLDASLSCNLDNLLPKKICDNGRAPITNIIASLKKALGNELANTFKPQKTSLDGLLQREPLTCNKMGTFVLSDQGIIAARTKYLESLLTPNFFLDLNKQLEEDGNYTNDHLNLLATHPLFRDVRNSPALLKKFVKSAMKAKDNKEIINLMNKTAQEENFSKKFSDRCKEAIGNVSTALKTIYCEKATLFSEDKYALEQVGNSHDDRLKLVDKNQFKSFCIDLNQSEREHAEKLKPFNFSLFSSDITKNIPSNDQIVSWASFHGDAHRTFYNADKESICNLMPPADPGCDDPAISNTQHCQMLQFLKEADKPAQSNLASKESRESINNIFRSMIGGADFSPETRETLKEAGILPGGTAADSKSNSYFYDKDSGKKVAASSMPAFKNGRQAAVQNGIKKDLTQGNPTNQAQTNLQDFTGNKSSVPSNEDSLTPGLNPKLNNQLDQNIADRLLRSKKPGKNERHDSKSESKTSGNKKAKASDAINDTFEPVMEGTRTSNAIRNIADNTRVNQPTPTNFQSNNSPKAKISSTKAEDKFNAELLKAKYSSPASIASDTTSTTLSKTGPKIEIVVPVADESILVKNAPELEANIKEYLETTGQSLLGAQEGKAFVVKLGKYEIDVKLDNNGKYFATCLNQDLHREYLTFLSDYFTGKMGGTPKRNQGTLHSLNKNLDEHTKQK